MRKKRVKIGWLKDRTILYDYDTGHVLKKGIRLIADNFEDFAFSPDGDARAGRDVLRLPLIVPKKSFWNNAGKKSAKVKVTVELI